MSVDELRRGHTVRKPGWITRHRWLVSLSLFVLIWHVGVWLFRVPAYLLPSPEVTVRSIISDASFLRAHVAATTVATLIGFGIAIGVGLAIAVLMSGSKIARDLIYPPLVLTQAIPLMAVAPIILIWFGLGVSSRVLIVAFVCFFPIAVSADEGFRAVDPGLRELLNTFGATRSDRYRHLYLPATLPRILAGMKIAATYSVLGAVVGEWLGGSRGIGVYMTRSLLSFRTDRLFGAVLIVMLMSFGLFKVVEGLERVLTPWTKRRNNA
ncbi:TPA: ABC transporter permease [Candidatus Acetothermia bacterium]|nr:ABC transporter permease [Candidatus Acetothermia bacterium]HAZ30100.1 ABC transporter permease [Candidatus Acetothermia bacterium]